MKSNTKHNKIGAIIKNGVVTTMMLCSFVLCYFAISSKQHNGIPSIGKYILVSIKSDSMKDVFGKGDLIISKQYKKMNLKKGDIITFFTIIDGKRVLNTHKIHNLWYDDDHELQIQTKGTNNNAVDEHIVQKTEVIGIYQFRVPFLGRVIQFMQSRYGFFVCILFPLVVAFLIQLFYTIVQFAIMHKDENVRKMKEDYTKEILELKQQMNELEKKYQSKEENHKT